MEAIDKCTCGSEVLVKRGTRFFALNALLNINVISLINCGYESITLK